MGFDFRKFYESTKGKLTLSFLLFAGAAGVIVAREESSRDAKKEKAATVVTENRPAPKAPARAAVLADQGTAGFLWEVKTHGTALGLGYFADRIEMRLEDGAAYLSVADNAVLRALLEAERDTSLRALLRAQSAAGRMILPKSLSYDGMEWIPATADSAILRQQQALATLGFEIYKQPDGVFDVATACALREFCDVTGIGMADRVQLTRRLESALGDASARARRFSNRWNNVSPAAAFAIREASRRQGGDYGYMMLLAAAESSFDEDTGAAQNGKSRSTAHGLYQFINSSWRSMVWKHGDKYGLGGFREAMTAEEKNDALDIVIGDTLVDRYLLSLRARPVYAAMICGESVEESRQVLAARLGRQPSRAEQYLAHFMGAGDAIGFISSLKRDPDRAAATLFPKAARSNASVFYHDGNPKTPRSLAEVYAVFERKFETRIYDEPPKKQAAKSTTKKRR